MVQSLHLITRFIDGGGAEKVVENQIQGLLNAERQYGIHLGFGHEYDQEKVGAIEGLGVETHCFDRIRHYSLRNAIPAVLQVYRYLRENQIDLIHTHSTEAGVIGRWAALLASTPIVIHEIHGDPIAADRSTVLNGCVWLLELISAPLATKLVVGSKRIQEIFLSRGIGTESQYELIHDGIEVERFMNHSPATLPESEARFRILFVGRLNDGKGLFDLIDAFTRLQRDDVDLLIVGDGPLAPALDERIRDTELDQSIHMLGYRKDVPALLAASELLVLPSYREGTPRVISEALASGTPVVSTRIAGIPEQVPHGKCGLLVDPGDIKSITRALERLLESADLREEMAQTCRSQAEKFSAENERKQIEGLYERLLDDIDLH
jgi:glycosyltransferase involved in cell wall biosynthesis